MAPNIIKGTVGKMRLPISKYGSNDTLNIFPPKVSHCRIAQFIVLLIDARLSLFWFIFPSLQSILLPLYYYYLVLTGLC